MRVWRGGMFSRRERSTGRRDWPLQSGLILLGTITFFPILFLVIASFKNNTQFYEQFWLPSWPPHPSNYSTAFAHLDRYIVNSIVYSSITVAGVIALASISGFVFARYTFPAKQFLFYAFISLLMVPGVLTLAPRFVLIRDLGFLNKPQALILPWIASGLVIGTWLMRNYFESIPKELFEAVRIDGGSEIDAFRMIAMPLALPMVMTVAINSLLATWDDLIWPLVTITDPDQMPLTVGLLRFSSGFETQWGTLFAGYVISAIPLLIVFVFSARQFVAGLTSGAIKG